MREPRRALPEPLPRSARIATWIQVTAVVAVFIALVVGLNRVARTSAERLVASNVARAAGLAVEPQVEIGGHAFLLQVIRGSYSKVDVTTTGLVSGPLRIDRVESHLVDVRVPFHDLLVRDIRAIGVGHSVEDVYMRYEDLNAYFDATGRSFLVTSAGNGKVYLDGNVDFLNQQLTVHALASVSANEGQLTIVPDEVETTGGTLNSAGRLLLNQRLRISIPMGNLPFGHQLVSAEPGDHGIDMVAEGRTIIVQP